MLINTLLLVTALWLNNPIKVESTFNEVQVQLVEELTCGLTKSPMRLKSPAYTHPVYADNCGQVYVLTVKGEQVQLMLVEEFNSTVVR